MVKRKAIKNPITGKIEAYTNSKTIGIRDFLTGKITHRIKKPKSLF